MKLFGILMLLSVIGGVANATEVDDKVGLGFQDARGAYQEVTFNV